MRVVLLVALCTMAAGCASRRPVAGPVRLGQTASVDGPRVRADRVVEDSRCPIDVTCVRAGRMIVQATVFGGGWSRQFDLELGTPVSVADGTLALVSATPLRRAGGRQVSASSYRFVFAFKGGR